MSNLPSRKIELLAPAKDFRQGCAAVLCGADALYVGAPRFGARSAAGVDPGQIGELCRFAHRYGVRVYVTMNTLLYEDELREAELTARRMWDEGADALIVQDMAFLRMDLPPVELHGSTQMYNADPQRLQFLAEAGFTRAILERALTLEQIAALSAAIPQIEIEAFVHGAICVGYSGRCYMSRTTGPRSGNRGDCSQACRLPYNLLDANLRPLEKNLHLLSVQDMNASQHLEALIDAGVGSLKIEGRLKDENYVRNVVGSYRRLLDDILARRPDLARASEGVSSFEFEPNPAKTFARGATSYFLDGVRGGVASFDSPKSMGEPLGRAGAVRRDNFQLPAAAELAPGDGICFTSPSGELMGTNVNRAEGEWVWPNRMDGIVRGTALYRNYDHLFVLAVGRSRLRRTIPVDAQVRVGADTIALTLSDGEVQATVSCKGAFDLAQQPEKAEQTLRTQLAKTGDTIFTIGALEIVQDVPRFVPSSMLNDLRREGVAALELARGEAYRRRERLPENPAAAFPAAQLTGHENVVNPLAERFYRDHGVESIEPGYDLRSDLRDCTVMRMRYCLRREMGQCLKENPAYGGKLFLENGLHLYELQFDCSRCEMSVVYRGERERIVRK